MAAGRRRRCGGEAAGLCWQIVGNAVALFDPVSTIGIFQHFHIVKWRLRLCAREVCRPQRPRGLPAGHRPQHHAAWWQLGEGTKRA